MAINFDSLLVAYQGEDWASISNEQANFLESCPINKRGWHYYQIPGGPTIHFKTGIDFRNPSVPYRVAKVSGLEVFARIGHRGSNDKVTFGRQGNRIWAKNGWSTMWMPADVDWCPETGAWEFYRMYFYPDFQAQSGEITAKERVIFWAAMRALPYDSSTGEKYLRESVQQWKQTVRHVAAGQSGFGIESAMEALLISISKYVKFMQQIKTQIDEIC